MLSGRMALFRELVLEERRMLLEILGASKKKSVRETVKRMHEIDNRGGVLEKAINVYWQRVVSEYEERFQKWRDIVERVKSMAREENIDEALVKAIMRGY
jgi:UTP:GlnB (protein PII) uridylyltransferase